MTKATGNGSKVQKVDLLCFGMERQHHSKDIRRSLNGGKESEYYNGDKGNYIELPLNKGIGARSSKPIDGFLKVSYIKNGKEIATRMANTEILAHKKWSALSYYELTLFILETLYREVGKDALRTLYKTANAKYGCGLQILFDDPRYRGKNNPRSFDLRIPDSENIIIVYPENRTIDDNDRVVANGWQTFYALIQVIDNYLYAAMKNPALKNKIGQFIVEYKPQ